MGLSYLRHKYGIRTDAWGEITERVVLFTSPEVASGKARSRPCELNDCGTISGSKKWPRGLDNAVEIVKRFYAEEIGSGTLYLCTLDVNDFSACFEAVAKTVLKFHRPGATGAHIWANITGGTNVLNAALFQAAYLSGFIVRLYYTFLADVREHGKYLQPFVTDRPELFDYREVFVLKTVFDERPYRILEELRQLEMSGQEWIEDVALWSRLGGKGFADFEVFRRDYLNILDGQGLRREGDQGEERSQRVRFDPEIGGRLLGIVNSPLFRTLARQEDISEDKCANLTADLKLQELWSRKQ
jgi:hypothetical protein